MPLTFEQIFTWAGKDKTRWRHLKGAVLIHNNFGECKITDFSEKNVYLGSLNKFSSFLSISKLATFESIPRGISEAITRDVQEAEKQREIRRHEMEAADRRKEDQRFSCYATRNLSFVSSTMSGL